MVAPTSRVLLNQSIAQLPLIGPAYQDKLVKLGITTLTDLLEHFPFRYTDLSHTSTIDSLKVGDTVTITGTIIGIQTAYTKMGKTIQRATFSDGTGTLKITWFNQPYLVKTFEQHPQVSLSGTAKIFAGKITLSSPQYELIKGLDTSHSTLDTSHSTLDTSHSTLDTSHSTLDTSHSLHTGRLVPVYPETAGVSSKWLRSRINSLLKLIPPQPDWLPPSIIHHQQLLSYDQAIRQIHFPDSLELAENARKRLSFDELFLWQLISQIRKKNRGLQQNQFHIQSPSSLLAPFIQSLPFQLTTGQKRALNDILLDLNGTTPMNRLLQGEVGSGKTVVAAAAIYLAVKQGYRAIVMAPTEILATQHKATISSLLKPFKIVCSLATKSQREDLESADVVIGTQAVLHRQLPKNIGLVIIDEQHRFGVRQRGQLIKTEKIPHLLSMTATPIPRTIALTLYTELDMSIIDELPHGRIPVKTWVVPTVKRLAAYKWIHDQVQSGGQAFVVCPLIEGSESEAMSEVKAAEIEYTRLSQEIFPSLKLGLVHGRIKSKEKDEIIKQFANKKIDILVATPVVEVGIDIPGATIMMIEGAERFGLAQLHQLRGRVGRNDKQSYCLLFSTSNTPTATQRLAHLESTQSGYQLAELDLKLRGPGNLYGIQQSGYIDLKIASLQDESLIRSSHREASALILKDPTLKNYPSIQEKLTQIEHLISQPN